MIGEEHNVSSHTPGDGSIQLEIQTTTLVGGYNSASALASARYRALDSLIMPKP